MHSTGRATWPHALRRKSSTTLEELRSEGTGTRDGPDSAMPSDPVDAVRAVLGRRRPCAPSAPLREEAEGVDGSGSDHGTPQPSSSFSAWATP